MRPLSVARRATSGRMPGSPNASATWATLSEKSVPAVKTPSSPVASARRRAAATTASTSARSHRRCSSARATAGSSGAGPATATRQPRRRAANTAGSCMVPAPRTRTPLACPVISLRPDRAGVERVGPSRIPRTCRRVAAPCWRSSRARGTRPAPRPAPPQGEIVRDGGR